MHSVMRPIDHLVLGPTVEPLDLDFIKKQRRLEGVDSLDTLLDLWNSAARQKFERWTGRALLSQTWEMWIDTFPCERVIELPHSPLQSVLSVKYDDTAGVEQTMSSSDYTVRPVSGDFPRPGRLELGYGKWWPSTRWQPNAVRVQFIAGYGDAPGDVPEIIRYALLMLVGHFHRFGEEVEEAQRTVLQQIPLGAQTVVQEAMVETAPLTRGSHYGTPSWLV